MKVEERKVYRCEFCPRYRLTKKSIEDHEPGCSANPDRKCRWGCDMPAGGLRPHIQWVQGRAQDHGFGPEDLAELRDRVEGCPMCMLSVLRQGITSEDRWMLSGHWDFEAEKERFNKQIAADEGRAMFEAAQFGNL